MVSVSHFYYFLGLILSFFAVIVQLYEQVPQDIDKPFKMNKVNLLWAKGRKRLVKEQLTNLYMDLKLQDEAEWNLKKMRSENSDIDGAHEAKVNKAMLGIMEKFKLSGVDGSYYKSYSETDNEISGLGIKADPNLAKLWDKAKRAGFSDVELLDLKEEFLHHQIKMQEYKNLYDELLKIDGISDNSIEQMKVMEMSMKQIKQKKKTLKELNREIKNNMQNLEQKTHQQQTKIKLDFTEPRVFDMWVQALNSNMSHVELVSFKEELQHFEHKIKKHDYMKEQAKLEQLQLHDRLSKDDILQMKKGSMTERAEQYQYKVKKLHTTLQDKLDKLKHTEL